MKSQRPRVVYWNSQPTPYMVGRWNAVARRGNLELHAWFNVRREPDRSWDVREDDWLFDGRYIHPRTVLGRTLFLPFTELRHLQPDVVVQEYSSLSYLLGLCAARSVARRVAFRALPTFDTWVRRRPHKELIKHALFRSVDGVKTGGEDGVRMFGRYGVPTDRIHPVTQSIDVAHFATARLLSSTERQQHRATVGLSGCVFLYVGRLWRAKGLDDLLDAFEIVQAKHPDVSLLLLGDGVDEERFRARSASNSAVRFGGFVQSDELPSWYALSDCLVFPTLGDPHGLVVEEAMAAGLPVICTEAAGDIRRRLPDGQAGFVVPTQDPITLADRMLRIAQDDVLRRRLACCAVTLVDVRDHERYAEDFERFVFHLLDNPIRRTPMSLIARTIGSAMMAASRMGSPRTLVGPS